MANQNAQIIRLAYSSRSEFASAVDSLPSNQPISALIYGETPMVIGVKVNGVIRYMEDQKAAVTALTTLVNTNTNNIAVLVAAFAAQAPTASTRSVTPVSSSNWSNWWRAFPFEYPQQNSKDNPLLPIRIPASTGPYYFTDSVLYFADYFYQNLHFQLPADGLTWVARIFADGEANFLKIYSSEEDAENDANARAYGSISSGTNPAWVLLHRGTSASNNTFGWLLVPNGFGTVTSHDGIRWTFNGGGVKDFAFVKATDAVVGKTWVLEAELNIQAAGVQLAGEPGTATSFKPRLHLAGVTLTDDDGEAGGFPYDFPLANPFTATAHARIRATAIVTGTFVSGEPGDPGFTMESRIEFIDISGVNKEVSVLSRAREIYLSDFRETEYFSLTNFIAFDTGTFELTVTRASVQCIQGNL